jgi:eukaryotic-like serine/threonine-protein kinase
MFERALVIDRSEALAQFVRACLLPYWPQAQIEVYPTAYGLPPRDFDWSRYQLVFIEHQVTGTETGLDLLRAIRPRLQDLPVIMVTASGDQDLAQRALELGAARYFNFADVSPRRLSECVAALIGEREHAERGLSGQSVRRLGSRSASRLDSTSSGGGIGPKIPGYSLRRKIADGGMATSILLAQRLEDQQQVILKILNLHGDTDQELLRRFMREYELIGKLVHPHVVRIYERGFAADFAYIAMEYLPAGDLKSRLTQALPARRAGAYLRQMAEGLGAVHELGIVHRDLKPSNVLFKDEHTLAIADFGIAKDLTNMHELTLPGAMLGTPYYASPEQLQDKPVDLRSDLYSLGVILYHMLTGQRPFEGSKLAQLIYAHAYSSVPQLPSEVSCYQPIVDGLLAKDPDERFQTAAEAIAGLDWVERSTSEAGACR